MRSFTTLFFQNPERIQGVEVVRLITVQGAG
jgi:hypothetical protein